MKPATANAADILYSSGGSVTFGEAGGQNNSTVVNAKAGASVEINTQPATLQIINDGAANDGQGANMFTTGDLTENGTVASLHIVSGAASNLTVATGSVLYSGTIMVQNLDADNASVAAATNGSLTGSSVTITNNESSSINTAVSLAVTGTVNTTGATSITAGASSDSAALTVSGNASFGSTVTVNGGANGGNATLTANGASAIFSAGFLLSDNSGHASLDFSGAANQTLFGTVEGGSAGSGTLEVNSGHVLTTTNTIGATYTLSQISVLGNSTLLSNANFSALNTNIASGSILKTNAAQTLTGDINGTIANVGTFDVAGTNATTTVVGNIGNNFALNAVDIEAGDTLAVDSTAANRDIHATNLTLEGAGSTLTLATGGNSIEIHNDVSTAINTDGAITTSGTLATFDNNVGSSADRLASITIGSTTVNDAGNIYANATTLDNGSTIYFDGGGAQTFAGTIDGNAAGNGTLHIGNSSGVTFTSAIGATNKLAGINVGGTTGYDSSATFEASTGAAPITIGNGGVNADTNTVTFDTANGAYAVSGTINGLTNGKTVETNNLTVSGGNTLTTSGVIGGGTALSNVNVTGAGTILASGANISAAALNVGTGATLRTTATQTLTGNVTGAGTLDAAGTGATTTVAGSIGGAVVVGTPDLNAVGAVDVEAGDTLIVDATAAARNANATALTLEGAGSTLGFTLAGHNAILANGVATAINGDGSLTTSGTGALTSYADVGSVSHALATVAIGGTTTLDMTHNIYANAVTLASGTSLVNSGGTNTISGTINGTGANDGFVYVTGDGTTTFGSAIGGVNAIDELEVDPGSTINVSHNVSAGFAGLDGTINVNAASNTVALTSTNDTFASEDGATVYNITGANDVTLAAAGGHEVDINGTVNTGLTGGSTLALNTTGTVIVGGNAATTINAGNAITTDAGTLTFGAHGTGLNIVVSNDYNPIGTNAPVINAAATQVNFAANSHLTVSATSVADSRTGGDITVIASSTPVKAAGTATTYDTLIGNGTIVLDNTALINLTDSAATNADDLVVTASYNTVQDVVGNRYAGAAQALINDPEATGTEGEARTNLLSAQTNAQARAVAESVSPTVDGSNVTAAENVSTEIFGVTSMHMDTLEGNDRNGSGSTGVSSGDLPAGSHSWGEIFGQNATEGDRDGVAGYSAHTYGGVVGFDTGVWSDRSHVGVALSYARTNAGSDNVNNTDTGINSYQATLYGDMNVGAIPGFQNAYMNSVYLKGMVAYAFNDNHTTRHDVGMIGGLDADGDYNANQIAARAELDRPFAMGSLTSVLGGLTLTPSLMADYTYYNANNYTESGAGTADLHIDQDSLNKLDLGGALAADYKIGDVWGGTFLPGVSFGYKYDVIGDNVSTTADFTGGGSAFGTDGATPARSQYDAGARLKYYTTQNWDFSAEYDYEFKSDYHSNNGLLRATYKF